MYQARFSAIVERLEWPIKELAVTIADSYLADLRARTPFAGERERARLTECVAQLHHRRDNAEGYLRDALVSKLTGTDDSVPVTATFVRSRLAEETQYQIGRRGMTQLHEVVQDQPDLTKALQRSTPLRQFVAATAPALYRTAGQSADKDCRDYSAPKEEARRFNESLDALILNCPKSGSTADAMRHGQRLAWSEAIASVTDHIKQTGLPKCLKDTLFPDAPATRPAHRTATATNRGL